MKLHHVFCHYFILVSTSELQGLADIFLELAHEEHVTERLIRITRRVSSLPEQLEKIKKDVTPILCIILFIYINIIDPYGTKVISTKLNYYGINFEISYI